MSVEMNLRALCRGDMRAGAALLPACRAAAFGTDLYGGEAIVEAFRRHPHDGDGDFLSAPGHAILWGSDRALIADLYGDHVARLWYLGAQAPLPREPAVSVPFDVDLAQAPSVVGFAASDHPRLDAAHCERVIAAAHDLAAEWRDHEGAPPAKARPFCLRAFSAGDRAVALFAVHVLDGLGARHAGFVHVAAVIGPDGAILVKDGAGEAAMHAADWRPRFG